MVSSSLYKKASLWPVWATLAIGLGSAAGAVFLYGMNQWSELPGRRPQLVRQVALRTTMLVIAALGPLGVFAWSPTDGEDRR